MEYIMNINAEPFALIIAGKKSIELRLNDERRQQIKIGDIIILINTTNPILKLTIKVIALYKFSSFKELYENLPLQKCGYAISESASYHDMEKYYPLDRQRSHGVVGIEFIIISSDIEKK